MDLAELVQNHSTLLTSSTIEGLPEAWIGIVDDLCKNVTEFGTEAKFTQIAEEHGCMRIRFEVDNLYRAMVVSCVREAENRAMRTCQKCGSACEKLYKRRTVLCGECSK